MTKDIMQRFATWGRRRLRGHIRRAGLGLGLLLAGLMGHTARAQFEFAAAQEVTGLWGSVSVDNSGGGDVDGINIAGQLPNAPVWFKWTPPDNAPESAEVTVDTIGSLDAFNAPVDTVLAVLAGNNVPSLYQVAANDDLYPSNPLQQNLVTQNFYSFNTNNVPPVTIVSGSGLQSPPFVGPSAVRFIAKKGVTYYFVADTKNGLTGTISLSWAYHSAGVLRFASEKIASSVLPQNYGDSLTDANDNPLLLYECAETEGYALVTVTRVGGYSGRIAVDYETTDLSEFADPDGFLPNGDEPAVEGTDYTAVTGTLIFDDFEMSKTIKIPVLPRPAPNFANLHGNHAFAVTLTAAQRDDFETTDVSDPRVDPVYGQIAVRILSSHVSPLGVDRVIRTNTIPATTNWFTTNVFNFDRANYRVTRPGTTNATKTYTIFVNRGGTDTNAITVKYRVTSGYPFFPNANGFNTEENIYFPLMPGSDYATPDPADITARVLGRNPDYTFPGGYTGDVSFGTKRANVVERQPLSFTVYNNGLSQFDEDFHIELYSEGDKKDIGMIGETTVTLLFQERNPPAGSVDQEFNADFNLNLDGLQVVTSPPNMTHPGTDGQVYGVAVQSDNKTLIVGDFFSYNGFSRNCIARINADGSLDTSFNPGTGIGAIAGYTDLPLFINDLALDPTNNTVLIVGSFTSFSGVPRGNIARLTSSGALDATFNPGAGANGPIWALYKQPADGKIVIGGDFTSYNGVPRKNIARLNSDGSLDTSFDASNAFNAPVYALAEQNGTFISIDRTATGTDLEDINTVNVGADSGVLTVDYDMLFVPDDLRVYYGGTNGVLIYDTGLISGAGRAVVPFGPTNGLTTNIITIVMNQGNGTPGTFWDYTASVQSSAANQLYVGGDFTAVGGIAGQDHIARLLGTGAVDATFDPNAGANGAIYTLNVQPDGKVLAGGEFTEFNSLPYNRLVRLNPIGTLDPDFFNGSGVDGTVYHVNAQTNGAIYVGGAFTAVNGTHRLGFARLNGDGTVDTTFLDSAYNQFAGLPRRYFSDPLGTVFSSAVQPNGGVIIGGSFDQVGGGQFDANVRPDSLDINQATVAHTRDGIRNRNNVARLIGGATPGPGNVGLLFDNYSVGKSGSALYVSLLRTNGYLGNATANFSVAPGVAQSGSDFYYNSPAPVYGVSWEFWGSVAGSRPFTRMHSDGLFGTNTFLQDSFRVVGIDSAAQVIVSVINNPATSGDASAQFQLNNPANSDLFYLGGQNMPLGVALGVSSAPLNIVDDRHQSGVVGFGKTDYVGSIRNVPISVTRSNGNYGQVSVHYATTTNGSTAVLNSDYNAASGTLNLLNGVTSNAFTVRVLVTNYITPVEKFVNLQLSSLQAPANGIATFGTTSAQLRIINPNFAGFLSFSTNDYQVDLSAHTAYVTIRRTVGSKGTVSVQFATADNTAYANTNYTAVSTNLTWNNGDVSPRVIAVPLLNDGSIGGAKQFAVSLSSPTLNGVGNLGLFTNTLFTPTNATVTINNDNSYGTFQFSRADYTVNENGGYATITVTRTGSLLGSASVDVETYDDGAPYPVDGVNYSGVADTLYFDPGQAAASFNIPILPDGVSSGIPPSEFYFHVDLFNNSPDPGTTLGPVSTALIHIVDAEDYNRPPGSADTTFDAVPGMNGNVFALARQNNGQLVAGGNFTTVNGAVRNHLARLNVDGTLDAAGFLNGLTGPNSAVFALASQTDDRVVLGGLFTTVNGVVRNRLARVMTDGSLDTSFNPGSGADGAVYALAETFVNDNRKILVGGGFNLINAAARPYIARLNGDGTVDTQFNAGTGPNGTVYAVAAYPTNSPFAGQVLIGGAFTSINNTPAAHFARLNANGSVDTNFNLGLGADGIVRAITIQDDGYIVIGGDFTNVSDVVGPLYSPHVARFYDYDDAGTHHGIIDEFFATAVGDGPNGPVNALALQADQSIIVCGEFTQAGGVTRNGITRLMYDGTTDPTINFGSGANAAIYATLVQPEDQMIVIGGAFTEYNGATHERIARIYGGSQTGSGAFEFTSAGYQVAENGLQALISVRRTGGTAGPNLDYSGDILVNLATTAGTAAAGVNYTDVTQDVTFPPGEVLKTVAVPVIDDFVITPDLTVNLTLSNPTAPAGFGDQSTAVLTIQNVDSAVAFSAGNYFAAKNILTGNAAITIVRQGTTNGTATVFFTTTTNGTATAGVDYTPTSGTVTFNPGEAQATVNIPILNNPLPTGNVTVTMLLSNAVGTLLSAPTNAVLTILDTVIAPGVLSFSTNSYTANEGAGSVLLTIVRTNGSSGPVSVDYTTVIGTAAPGINYASTTGTTTLGDGVSSRTIAIPLIDNNLVQGPVSFSVTLSGPTGGAALTAPTSASVTIEDNDMGLTFALATNTVSETAGVVSVNVLRLNVTTGTVTVDYATTNGTALAGINYSNTAGTLTFTNGESLKTILVPLISDPAVTGDLQFGVRLFNPGVPAVLTAPSNTVVVIQDADAGLSFTNATFSVLKNAGTAVITVVCSNPGVEPVIVDSNTVPLAVDYFTTNGTATAGVDYVAVSGRLVFTNGIATNTFTVPLLNGGALTGNRTFTVCLTNATAPGKLVAPSNQVVTIVDSNSGLRFSSSGYTVYKNGVAAVINVLRTGYTNSTLAVDFLATNGTAVAGLNYVATNGTLVFANGVTTRSFTVPVIDNNIVQANKTVLLQLLNATNGITVAPSVATLTIFDSSGSLVVPAGAALIGETGTTNAPNGMIDTNETVTVLFAFRAAGGTNVANLNATLLATNGVTAPSAGYTLGGSATGNYGALTVRGHSVFRPFTFTARGTNALPIFATFSLADGVKSLGLATFTFTQGSWTTSFANTNVIVINDNATASPYPSVLQVSGIGTTLLKATVTLTNLTHTSPADIAALVMAPNGSNTLFMANAGGQNAINHVTLNFDDAATNVLSRTGQISSGTNRPSAYLPVLSFP